MLKISHGENLEADKIINYLEKMHGFQEGSTVLDDDELASLADDLFYSWFSGEAYVISLYKNGSLILRVEIPNHLKTYVEEAKKCYAFKNIMPFVHSIEPFWSLR